MSARWYGTLVAIGSACASQATARPSHWQAPAMANCASAPAVGHPTGFRHLATRVAGGLGEPRHRGADVIATESEPQVVRGVLAYTAVDKAAEDEDIEVYACTPTGWRALGTTRTDDDGRFALTLAGDARLPIGLHALAISVVGDRSGAELTALIAPRGTAVAVSDVDGTLTSSENAIVGEVVLHRDVAAKPDAGAALQALVARGLPIVYLTVRARRFDQLTHRWLASHGMPRGPILEAESITLPGRAACRGSRASDASTDRSGARAP